MEHTFTFSEMPAYFLKIDSACRLFFYYSLLRCMQISDLSLSAKCLSYMHDSHNCKLRTRGSGEHGFSLSRNLFSPKRVSHGNNGVIEINKMMKHNKIISQLSQFYNSKAKLAHKMRMRFEVDSKNWKKGMREIDFMITFVLPFILTFSLPLSLSLSLSLSRSISFCLSVSLSLSLSLSVSLFSLSLSLSLSLSPLSSSLFLLLSISSQLSKLS